MEHTVESRKAFLNGGHFAGPHRRRVHPSNNLSKPSRPSQALTALSTLRSGRILWGPPGSSAPSSRGRGKVWRGAASRDSAPLSPPRSPPPRSSSSSCQGRPAVGPTAPRPTPPMSPLASDRGPEWCSVARRCARSGARSRSPRLRPQCIQAEPEAAWRPAPLANLARRALRLRAIKSRSRGPCSALVDTAGCAKAAPSQRPLRPGVAKRSP